MLQAEKEKLIMKRLMAKCSVFSVLVLTAAFLATPVMSAAGGRQEGMDNKSAPSEMGKKHKQDRWEGFITRSDKDKNKLTVREVSSGVEKDVVYDNSTEWTSQEHGSKKVNMIDAGQVKDHDRVICLGKYDKKGVLHATLISKRLTHGED
jgi:hypothetical protein